MAETPRQQIKRLEDGIDYLLARVHKLEAELYQATKRIIQLQRALAQCVEGTLEEDDGQGG